MSNRLERFGKTISTITSHTFGIDILQGKVPGVELPTTKKGKALLFGKNLLLPNYTRSQFLLETLRNSYANPLDIVFVQKMLVHDYFIDLALIVFPVLLGIVSHNPMIAIDLKLLFNVGSMGFDLHKRRSLPMKSLRE